MKLHYWPSQALKTRSKPLDTGLDHADLVNELITTMKRHSGIGLAANQVGLTDRIFVADIPDTDFRGAFVNPVILAREGRVKSVEGCLSFPGVSLEIERSMTVEVEYWDPLEGETVNTVLRGLSAVCFQHELDHLDGVVFTDRVSKLKRNIAMKKMRR